MYLYLQSMIQRIVIIYDIKQSYDWHIMISDASQLNLYTLW